MRDLGASCVSVCPVRFMVLIVDKPESLLARSFRRKTQGCPHDPAMSEFAFARAPRLSGVTRHGLLWPALLGSGLLHLVIMWVLQPRPAAWHKPALQIQLQAPLTGTALLAPKPLTDSPQPARQAAQHQVLVAHAERVLASTLPAAPQPSPQPPRWSSLDRIAAPAALPAMTAGSSTSARRQMISDHALKLERWLERHQRYPRAARRAGIEGVVQLQFVLTSEGRVEAANVRASSGAPVLDRAALELLQSAAPLPWPQGLEVAAIEVQVPVRFELDPGN